MMNSSTLRLVGYACILNAALSIPILIFGLYISATGQSIASNIIQIVSLGFFVYITLALKGLLSGYKFEDVNTLLDITIGLNAFAIIMGINSSSSVANSLFSVAGLLSLGIVMLIIGIKLQRCTNDLHGLLKPFSYLMMATGVCLASILLTPFAVLLWMAMGIVQGMIFLKEAEAKNNFLA